MTQAEIKRIVAAQHDFFSSGATLRPDCRVAALKRLKEAIRSHEAEISQALKQDLGKGNFEGYMCEIGLALSEISYMIKHTRKFSRERRVRTPIAQFVSRSFVKPSPYGVTLVMSPWNYPFLLSIDPLVDAVAAGNTVILKPSAYSPATSEVIQKIIAACFDERYVTVVTGGREENKSLLTAEFDYIFFTGSQFVGKEVMKSAADRLTPITLELGGKSPCIVDKSANIALAAKRIAFGKYLNCGQTCVAPDYVYCHESAKDRLISELKREIEFQFGDEPLQNKNYGKIVNEKHFDRVMGLIDTQKTVIGGHGNRASCQITPTVMDRVTWHDAVMQEEIFGPVLPILTYEDPNEMMQAVNAMPHPLALYLFAQDKQLIREVTQRCRFGGGCINDTIIHLATTEMGFGGVGASGMGAYHGKVGFDTFSHRKSIVDKKTILDLPMRYQPYTAFHEKIIRRFLR